MNKTSIIILGDFSEWYGVNRRNFYQAISKNDIDEIDVFLSSYGGEAAEALTIYDMLRGHKAKVNIYLSGVVASAATIVACAGDNIIASPSNIYMIHKASLFTFGNSDDLRYSASILDVFDEKIVSIFEKRVSNKKTLKKENIWKLLNDATWMTSETAAELGFVDIVQDFTFDFEGQQIGWGIFATDPKKIETVENYETNIKVIQSAIKSKGNQFIHQKNNNMKILNSIASKVVAALVTAGFISEDNKDKAVSNISDVDFDSETITEIVRNETKAFSDSADIIKGLETKIQNQETQFKELEKKLTDAIASNQFAGINNPNQSNGNPIQKPNNGSQQKVTDLKLEFYKKAVENKAITKEEYKEITGLDY